MAFLDRVPPEIRPKLPWIGGFLVIVVLWTIVQEAKENDARRAAILSPAQFAAVQWSADSVVACSDSALLVQRRVRGAVSRQLLADMEEPSKTVGDSAYLAWQHRRGALAEGVPAGKIYADMAMCGDYGRR